MAVLDAGAEEVHDLGDGFEVVCEPPTWSPSSTALQDAGIDYDSAEAGFVPICPSSSTEGERPRSCA